MKVALFEQPFQVQSKFDQERTGLESSGRVRVDNFLGGNIGLVAGSFAAWQPAIFKRDAVNRTNFGTGRVMDSMPVGFAKCLPVLVDTSGAEP